MDQRYTVAQAVKLTGVKSYVLRYWEEELNLRIGRTELGHRFYTGYDIQLFLNIKELKNRGLKLAAIAEMLPKIARNPSGSTGNKVRLLEGEAGENVEICEESVSEEDKFPEGDDIFEKDGNERSEGDKILNEKDNIKIIEFEKILERLIAQELNLKKSGEARCRSLDAAIRRQQQVRKLAAAASEKKAESGMSKGWRKKAK